MKGYDHLEVPEPILKNTGIGASRGTGKNGVRRNGVVHKRGLSEILPCGHAKRLFVAGKCIGCEVSGPTLEHQPEVL